VEKPSKPKRKRYINYVSFVNELQELTDPELQDEMEFRKATLRICEQELRRRRNNERIIQGTKRYNSVASEQADGSKH
jgi:hypothetical protein